MRYCPCVFCCYVSNDLCLPNSIDDQADQRLCLPPLIQVAGDNGRSRVGSRYLSLSTSISSLPKLQMPASTSFTAGSTVVQSLTFSFTVKTLSS